MNSQQVDSRLPFRRTIAAHFLSYFFGFYLLMLVLTLIAAYGDDAPQRQLMQRMAGSLLARSTELLLHRADLAVSERAIANSFDLPFADETAVCFFSWPGGQRGQRPADDCIRSLQIGSKQFKMGLDPQKLAQQLHSQMIEDGIQSVTLFDSQGQQLAVYPEASNGFYVFSNTRMILPLPGLALKAELSRSARFFPQSIWRGVFMALSIGLFRSSGLGSLRVE